MKKEIYLGNYKDICEGLFTTNFNDLGARKMFYSIFLSMLIFNQHGVRITDDRAIRFHWAGSWHDLYPDGILN